MKYILSSAVILILLGITLVFNQGVSSSIILPGPASERYFNSHWRQGMAEITRYDLEQERYGEIHRGEAVLIYVVEPFLPVTQVKYEGKSSEDSPESVLKLNFSRKFHTGIYPYSMMTSVFSPLATPGAHPYKVTQTSQEWCGHAFTQINNRGSHYDVHSFSYYQESGDELFRSEILLLEDELWTRVRLDPSALPTGRLQVIPRFDQQHMRHVLFSGKDAVATIRILEPGDKDKEEVVEYEIRYVDIPRTLRLRFNKAFPHRIVAWEEEIGGNGPDGRRVTRARMTHAIMSDYWNRNSVSDSTLRTELGMLY